MAGLKGLKVLDLDSNPVPGIAPLSVFDEVSWISLRGIGLAWELVKHIKAVYGPPGGPPLWGNVYLSLAIKSEEPYNKLRSSAKEVKYAGL